jgi:cobalamin synthase
MVWLSGSIATAIIILPAFVSSLWIGQIATRRIDGLTGDVMGASTMIAEIMMLMCWAALGAMLPA